MTRITKSRNLIVAYTVPKLKDFSPAALDKASEILLAALKKESADIKAESDWKQFRDRWLARKNGVLTQINELWLKAAPANDKRYVGQRVNGLKKRVEERVALVRLHLEDRVQARHTEQLRSHPQDRTISEASVKKGHLSSDRLD